MEELTVDDFGPIHGMLTELKSMVDKVRDEIDKLEERVPLGTFDEEEETVSESSLEDRMDRLERLLEQAVHPTIPDAAGSRKPITRVPGHVRDNQVLEVLRGSPDKIWMSREMAQEAPMPQQSAVAAMIRVADQGLAEVVEPPQTPNGAPQLRYKPTRVRPGEGVQ